MSKPRILITNDDGIDSFFLRVLVEAHLKDFEVFVAAPKSEKSWISRAITRDGIVQVTEDRRFDCPAWALDGTPTDCINIGLGHLLPKDRLPDAILSGINLGYNAAFPFILSSGTIAGALEGVLWGLPGIAFSHMVPENTYEILRASHGQVEGALANSLQCAGTHCVSITRQVLEQDHTGVTVHNINFPISTQADTPLEQTIAERFQLGTLFEAVAEDSYAFKFQSRLIPLVNTPDTDRACLERGNISWSRLDYSKLAAPVSQEG